MMTRKTKVVIAIIVSLAVLAGGFLLWTLQKKAAHQPDLFEKDGLTYVSKVEGKDFLVYSEGAWQKKFLTGVNIGAGKPGSFPGELAITKNEYLRWFRYIKDMNADVVRVYTTLRPEFYEALYEFNARSGSPVYLLQGVWVSEEDIAVIGDAYAENGKIRNDFIRDATDLVDVIHGKANLPERPGFASGRYTKDVSPYVIGWILGIEWDPNFVENTNTKNPASGNYSGRYLYTDNASPFEAFLCGVGDEVLQYEVDKYHMTRALSYANWPTTDMLNHPNEPYPEEDMAVVNMEHIRPGDSFPSGLFASYHVYPYYPDFLNYQKDLANFKDETGMTNTYQAYLRALMKEHTMPVLVAEFGVPASRGKAHENIHSGFNQGNIDETQQGLIAASLLQDIHDEGYCGALVFAWQDEWFKRSWNTMDFDLPDRRPYWSNPQTNEQEFGLLAFDPGANKSVAYVDGDISDWNRVTPLVASEDSVLHVKSDEKYVYFMVKTSDFDFVEDVLYIPVDTIQGQGNTADGSTGLEFERPADFLIRINGTENSKILVDSYYDSFYFMYAEQSGLIEKNPGYRVNGSGLFNSMYLCLSRGFVLPEDKRTVPFTKFETGRLVSGDANPEHQSFNSLTDFSYKDGNIEIRIPWQLLNVMDPSSNSIMGDLYANNSINAEVTKGFNIGSAIVRKGEVATDVIKMGFYAWNGWDSPTYHERLKPSYYILKDAFKALG